MTVPMPATATNDAPSILDEITCHHNSFGCLYVMCSGMKEPFNLCCYESGHTYGYAYGEWKMVGLSTGDLRRSVPGMAPYIDERAHFSREEMKEMISDAIKSTGRSVFLSVSAVGCPTMMGTFARYLYEIFPEKDENGEFKYEKKSKETVDRIMCPPRPGVFNV